jgi:hypothetical protein
MKELLTFREGLQAVLGVFALFVGFSNKVCWRTCFTNSTVVQFGTTDGSSQVPHNTKEFEDSLER